MAEAIRVLVVDDHAVVREGLRTFLELQDGIVVVGEAGDGEAGVSAAERLRPDVVLMDLVMPRLDGVGAMRRLRRRLPATRVIVLTSFADDERLLPAIRAGAAGYLLKDAPSHQLADAIRRVHGGLRAVDPGLASEAWSEPDPLTDRERQVLRLAADGQSGADIAGRLHLSEGTVRNYLSEAVGKLGGRNKVDAARIARAKGWL